MLLFLAYMYYLQSFYYNEIQRELSTYSLDDSYSALTHSYGEILTNPVHPPVTSRATRSIALHTQSG